MKRKTLSMFAWMTMVIALSVPATAAAKGALTDEEALSRIEQVPEVHAFILQTARSKGGVKPFIRPEEGSPDVFAFCVGESHATHTVTWNRFTVNKKSGAILVLDIETGDVIPLEQWRAKRPR